MNQREEEMLEEIFRLERELSKYKWTEEHPWWLMNYRYKVELFWEEEGESLSLIHI